jgi:hypothetical protein
MVGIEVHTARATRGFEIFDDTWVSGLITSTPAARSLLAKIGPVSLASPPEDDAAKNVTMNPSVSSFWRAHSHLRVFTD